MVFGNRLIIFGPRRDPNSANGARQEIAELTSVERLKNTLEDEIRTEELQDARKSAQIPPTASVPGTTSAPPTIAVPEGETTPRVDTGA